MAASHQPTAPTVGWSHTPVRHIPHVGGVRGDPPHTPEMNMAFAYQQKGCELDIPKAWAPTSTPHTPETVSSLPNLNEHAQTHDARKAIFHSTDQQ